jgi:hypothetical protein
MRWVKQGPAKQQLSELLERIADQSLWLVQLAACSGCHNVLYA